SHRRPGDVRRLPAGHRGAAVPPRDQRATATRMTNALTFTTPDWLALHGGELRRGLDEFTWLVLLGGAPQYRLDIRPAKGKFMCAVMQTVNGRRLDRGG